MRFLLLLACGPQPLVALDQFTLIEGPCGFVLEEGYLEINTSECSGATVSAPALRDLGKGTHIRCIVSHSTLRPPDMAAEARITVATLSLTIALPAEVKTYIIEGELPFDLHRGDPVVFSVTNHGGNDYRLLSCDG